MSTYYYFGCDECKEYGGLLTRQAWGWGNFDIYDSFAFLRHHIAECGPEHIVMFDENDARSERDEWTHAIESASACADEAKDWEGWRVVDYRSEGFPHASEWSESETLYRHYKAQRDAARAGA